MQELVQVQRDFVHSIYQNDNRESLVSIIHSDTISASARLTIYRNNVHQALINALVLTYPVLAKVVDERFFRYAASQYIKKHPSMSGNLEDYGRDMPQFLEQFEPVAHLPYVPDIARFEWAYLRSDQARDCEHIDIETLQRIPESLYERLCFKFHPGATVVMSSFPVYSLWKQVLDDPESVDVNMAQGGENLLLCRNNMDVQVVPIKLSEAIFLEMLSKGESLLAAYEKVIAEGNGRDFDLIASICDAIRRHVFVAYSFK